MFKIVFTERAIKDLYKLDKQCQIRIAQKLKEYSISPFEHLIKLTNPIIGTYRFRIGDYRVIFDIVENSIVVLRLGHRKSIYL